MLDIPSISAIVATVGVLVGVTLAYLEVRTLVKQRQTDLVMRLYSTYGSKEFQEALHETWTMEYKGLDDFEKKFPVVASVPSFFEGIGVLVKRKLTDMSLVDDLFSSAVLLAWEKWRPPVREMREKYKRPQIWEWFEYLYNEMQKREQRL